MPENVQPAARAVQDYQSLISPDKKAQVQAEFERNQHERFTLKNSTFAVFSDKSLSDEEKKELDSSWKVHISIEPDDITSAWDIIYPMLHDSAAQFKIVNMMRAKERMDHNQMQLEAVKQQKNQFMAEFSEGKGSLDALKLQASMLCQGRDEYAPYLENPDKLYELVLQKYEQRVEQQEKIVEENARIINGMQVTIYIPPGDEVKMYDLAKHIEGHLKEAGIKPGSIHQSDKTLGDFVSYRHPGIEYQDAVDVSSHNPDGVADPIAKVVASLEGIDDKSERETVLHDQLELASFKKKFDGLYKNYQCRAKRRTNLLENGADRADVTMQKNQEAKNTAKAIHYELKSYNAGDLPEDNQLRKLYELSAKANEPGAAAHTNFRAVLADMKRLREGKDVMTRMNKYKNTGNDAIDEGKLLSIFLKNLNHAASDKTILNPQMQGSQFIRDKSNIPANIEAFNQNEVFDCCGNLKENYHLDGRAANNLFDLNTGKISDASVMQMSSAINYAYIQTMKQLQQQIVALDSTDPKQAQKQEQLMNYKNDLGYNMVAYLNESAPLHSNIHDLTTLQSVSKTLANTVATQSKNENANIKTNAAKSPQKKSTKSWRDTVCGIRHSANDAYIALGKAAKK
jgi:hypothetical protein